MNIKGYTLKKSYEFSYKNNKLQTKRISYQDRSEETIFFNEEIPVYGFLHDANEFLEKQFIFSKYKTANNQTIPIKNIISNNKNKEEDDYHKMHIFKSTDEKEEYFQVHFNNITIAIENDGYACVTNDHCSTFDSRKRLTNYLIKLNDDITYIDDIRNNKICITSSKEILEFYTYINCKTMDGLNKKIDGDYNEIKRYSVSDDKNNICSYVPFIREIEDYVYRDIIFEDRMVSPNRLLRLVYVKE